LVVIFFTENAHEHRISTQLSFHNPYQNLCRNTGLVGSHAATIPTLLALMTGLSDRTPNLDVVLFAWAGLVLLFFRAVVLKDLLNIITIGLGFIIQAVLMALILFK